MAKLTRKAFEHFKGIYELKECSWIVDDDYYKEVVEPELDKMLHTKYMAEFMFKCLYPDERPLSKKDYGRTRFTHRKIDEKMNTLAQVRTKSEDEAFQRGWRRLQIGKGLYPFGIREDDAIEKYEEIRIYYEEGRYRRGSFVDKFIAHIHHI